MRVLHNEVLQDNEYCVKYYSPFHRLMNKGGYCLVSKKYFQFGSYLMKSICSNLTVDGLLNQHRNTFLRGVKDTYLNDDVLFQKFIAVDKESEASKMIDTTCKKKIFHKII